MEFPQLNTWFKFIEIYIFWRLLLWKRLSLEPVFFGLRLSWIVEYTVRPADFPEIFKLPSFQSFSTDTLKNLHFLLLSKFSVLPYGKHAAQKHFCTAHTWFRAFWPFSPQFLADCGPNYGNKVELRPRDQLGLDAPVITPFLPHTVCPTFSHVTQ
jgi:hypothetical protein